MTLLDRPAPAEPPTVGLAALPAQAPAEDRDIPVRAPDTELFGAQPGSGYKVPPLLVRRSDGQVIQVSPLLYSVLDAVDGQRDLAEIARVAGTAADRELAGEDVATLLDGKLRPLGLVLARDGGQATLKKAAPLLALRARFVVAKPELTRRITAPFAALFHPAVVAVCSLAFAAVAFWVLFVKGLASAAYQAFQRPGLLLAVFAITVISAGFHEFGHAAALRRGGGTPGAMGAGLYLIYPVFYTEVTDSYRLSRAARIRTDLGGLYFNALVALLSYGVWLLTRWDGVLLVIAAQVLQMIRQLPPLLRFDGYHLLSDVTGVPDLYHRIGPTLRSFLPRRWRRPESKELKLWARVVVTGWTVLVVPLLAVTMLLAVVALPRIVGTTWHSLLVQARQFHLATSTGAYAAAGTKVLAMIALLVPVGGIFYILIRSGRRYLTAMWRRTSGRPAQRGIACVALAAVTAGLVFVWWPRHGVYEPLYPGERGTVQDAVPAANASVTNQAVLVAGEQRTATTVWASGAPIPTKANPVLAVVLVPKSGTGPTWVFPFNPPPRPGPGDNQALAIVTRDGGTAYSVAFALVWAKGNTILNANSAYALASCRRCAAVAVAFQVVLVVGQAHIIAPQNVAAAVSYDCLRCVTAALASQLVITLPGGATPALTREIDLLWATILRWSHNIKGLSLAQIRSQLLAYEAEIIAIVQPYATPQPSASGVWSSTSPVASPIFVPSSAPSTSQSGAVSPSQAQSSQSSPSSSQSPSSAPSSPTPTPSPS